MGVTSKFPLLPILLGACLYLSLQALVVGVPAISGSSEAREAQVIDVIGRDGTWILPLRNGVVPSKPPLYHWLGALFSRVYGGVDEFAARFPCQLYAAITIVMVSLVAYRFAVLTQTSQGPDHPRRSALLAGAILSLSYGFYQLGCQAMVDMTFTLCTWGALSSVALTSASMWRYEGRVSPWSRCFFWLFVSLAALARGPLGAALPIILTALAGGCAIGLRRTLWELLRPTLCWLFIAIPFCWYWLAYQQGGDAFLERQIFFENLKRLSGGEYVNTEAWWFYLPSFIRTTFPWGIITLFLFIRALSRPEPVSYRGRFVILWLPAIVLCSAIALVSLSSGKRHSYLLPLIPLVAIQLSVELSSILERRGVVGRRALMQVVRRVEIGLACFLLASGVGLALLADGAFAAHSLMATIQPAVEAIGERLAPLFLVAALVGILNYRSVDRICYLLWILGVLSMTGIVNLGATVKAELKGFDAMSLVWLTLRGPHEELAVIKHPFDEYFDPILFYVRRPVSLISTEDLVFSCEARMLYAARASWLSEQSGDVFRQIETVGLMRERWLSIKNDTSKDLVFFRCKSERPQDTFEPPPLQDASGSRYRMPAIERAHARDALLVFKNPFDAWRAPVSDEPMHHSERES